MHSTEAIAYVCTVSLPRPPVDELMMRIAGTEGLYTELQGKMMGNKATE